MREATISNADDIGQVAETARQRAGLRQQDVHSATRLATRFISEVEHGKDSAQVGKVIDLLDNLGLEVVVRPKLPDQLVNPRALGFTKERFWSSGETLPAKRVVARVLADPTESDIRKLVLWFGFGPVIATWSELKRRGEVSDLVAPVTL